MVAVVAVEVGSDGGGVGLGLEFGVCLASWEGWKCVCTAIFTMFGDMPASPVNNGSCEPVSKPHYSQQFDAFGSPE